MSNDKNIENLINGVIHPDVSETIEDYNKYDDQRKYETILSILCSHVRNLASRNITSPYIQLKDSEGNFVFNERLTIKIHTDKIKAFDTSLQEHQADMIYDGKSEYFLYFMISYMTKKGAVRDFGGVKIDTKILETNPLRLLYLLGKPLAESVNYLQKELGEVFPNEYNVNANDLFHEYDDKTKTWSITHLLDNARLILE